MVPTSALPRSPGHPFYAALNKLLAEAKFDAYVEGFCEPLYREGGRPSIPPGVYSRMLSSGYFEGIDSQRGIAWRCSDSLSLRSFLGLKPTESTPDHSSLTIIRERGPKERIEQVFSVVLAVAFEKKHLKGKSIGVDATTLEANAAMKSIVRRDGGATWKAYLTKLAKEAGMPPDTGGAQRATHSPTLDPGRLPHPLAAGLPSRPPTRPRSRRVFNQPMHATTALLRAARCVRGTRSRRRVPRTFPQEREHRPKELR